MKWTTCSFIAAGWRTTRLVENRGSKIENSARSTKHHSLASILYLLSSVLAHHHPIAVESLDLRQRGDWYADRLERRAAMLKQLFHQETRRHRRRASVGDDLG